MVPMLCPVLLMLLDYNHHGIKFYLTYLEKPIDILLNQYR